MTKCCAEAPAIKQTALCFSTNWWYVVLNRKVLKATHEVP